MNDFDKKVSRYLDWIDAEVEYVRDYHDQKERAAWTATAFYVPTVIFLGYHAGNVLEPGKTLRVVVSLLVGAALGIILMFVSMQFNRRWVVADAGAALRRLRAELIADPSLIKAGGAESLPDRTAEIPVWPAFIRSRILEHRTKRSAAQVWAAAVRGMLFMWGAVWWPPLYFMPSVEMRTRSEAASYCAIVLAALLGLRALWS